MLPKQSIIGVGSPHGDDRIGWLIADEVQVRLGSEVCVQRVSSPLEILDWIDGVEWLGICDACRGIGNAGEWQCWTWPDRQIAHSEFIGSHDIGLTAVLALAARLGRLPETVKIWGVEIGSCLPIEPVSCSANTAISRVADDIIEEIERSRLAHYA